MTEQDDILTSGFVGETGVAGKVMEKDVRILSTAKVYEMTKVFQEKTGLKRKQFAVNGWGFPFMPIPVVEKAYGNVRIAPKNITKAFFGHPIYWIDPELTVRRSNEGEQEWCIRMFYLIDSMGFWTEDLEFIDFLEVNDFSFNDAQIETYHRIADQNCETDLYELLGEKDLYTSLSAVEEEYRKILRRCFLIQEKESLKMLKVQADQYQFAKKALGPEVFNWVTNFDDPGSVWHKKFYPKLSEIAEEYNTRAQTGNQIVSDLQKEARKLNDILTQFIVRYNHATSILELPVKASIEGNPGGAARISYIASSMALANRKDNLRKTLLAEIEEGMQKSFGSGNAGTNGFDHVIKSMEKIYSVAWDRMRLAYVNYYNLVNGETVHSSSIEMRSAMQTLNSPEGDSLLSVLKEDFAK